MISDSQILVVLYQVLAIVSPSNRFVVGFSFFIHGSLAPLIVRPSFLHAALSDVKLKYSYRRLSTQRSSSSSWRSIDLTSKRAWRAMTQTPPCRRESSPLRHRLPVTHIQSSFPPFWTLTWLMRRRMTACRRLFA